MSQGLWVVCRGSEGPTAYFRLQAQDVSFRQTPRNICRAQTSEIDRLAVCSGSAAGAMETWSLEDLALQETSTLLCKASAMEGPGHCVGLRSRDGLVNDQSL